MPTEKRWIPPWLAEALHDLAQPMCVLDFLLAFSGELPGCDWKPDDRERLENLRLARAECARLIVLMRQIQNRLDEETSGAY